jgi:hypothetical protein
LKRRNQDFWNSKIHWKLRKNINCHKLFKKLKEKAQHNSKLIQ